MASSLAQLEPVQSWHVSSSESPPGASGIAILAALVTVAYLYNDINNFFRRHHERHGGIQGRSPRQVFGRKRIAVKRHDTAAKVSEGTCSNCGAQPNNCPAGPPGPPGTQHLESLEIDGEDGQPGMANTAPAYDIPTKEKDSSCIMCPPGEPGPPA
ncbi:hypothetical protein OSTOST_24491 [Ostertagia ostertagi]